MRRTHLMGASRSDPIRAIRSGRPADMAIPPSNARRGGIVARHRAGGRAFGPWHPCLGVRCQRSAKWTQWVHQSGSMGPATVGGGRRRLLEPHREGVPALPSAGRSKTLKGRTGGARSQAEPGDGEGGGACRGGRLQKNRRRGWAKTGRTWPGGAGDGAPVRQASSPSAWSSSLGPDPSDPGTNQQRPACARRGQRPSRKAPLPGRRAS